MNWLQANLFRPRPIVAVEDHVYHISELLRHLQTQKPELISSLTVVCLDRSGPDTDAAIGEWLGEYPTVQIAARVTDDFQTRDDHRVALLEPPVFTEQNQYCLKIAAFLRSGGLLLQDIDLETLDFVPRDRWWESTMLASTVRGIVGSRPPKCAFISNKRGYEATFGAELFAAGHDPRDVLNKYELERIVVPFLGQYLDRQFPWTLNLTLHNHAGATPDQIRVSIDAPERILFQEDLDIVLWPSINETRQIGGKGFANSKSGFLTIQATGNEAVTWFELLSDRQRQGEGIDIQEIGSRIAPHGAGRPEITNAAARHIHTLRKRLHDKQAIVTVSGRYRLRDDLKIGIASCAAHHYE